MADLMATLFVTPSTPIGVRDQPHPDLPIRIVVVTVGDLSMHIGAEGDDALVDVTGRLIDVLAVLRGAAMERNAAREAAVA